MLKKAITTQLLFASTLNAIQPSKRGRMDKNGTYDEKLVKFPGFLPVNTDIFAAALTTQ